MRSMGAKRNGPLAFHWKTGSWDANSGLPKPQASPGKHATACDVRSVHQHAGSMPNMGFQRDSAAHVEPILPPLSDPVPCLRKWAKSTQ